MTAERSTDAPKPLSAPDPAPDPAPSRAERAQRPTLDVRVRPAYPRDVAVLIEFNRAMAAETEGRELDPDVLGRGVAAVLEDPAKGAYFVAEHDGRVVGGLMVTYEWSDWRDATFWWIQSVYVRPEARGAGVFRRLYADLLARARGARGVAGLRLYVERENERAQRTYQAVGMHASHYRLFEVDFVLGDPPPAVPPR